MTDLTILSVPDYPFGNAVLDDVLMAQVQPYVHRLEKLTLMSCSNERVINCQIRQFSEFHIHNLPFLRSLTLKNFDVDENCLRILSNGLSNITEIYLNDMAIFRNVDQFQLFLNRLTNLQVFVYMNCDVNLIHIEAIADCLSKRFPQLKGFGCSIQQVLWKRKNRGIGDHFKFLEKFKHLTEVYVSGPINLKASCDIQNAIKFVPNIKRLSL